ncbi:MAG: DNA-binding response regulator, partial [Bacteroidia bacterium]|nr:DNA-binding response regulator [Bacteroidia bacterium]
MRLPSNRSILIVEDNRYYASMIENHLHQYPGFTVAAFDNGDAAMEAYDRVRPDIVL